MSGEHRPPAAATDVAPSPPSPVASLRGVSRRFGPHLALDAVDLDLPPGAVALLGPNGAGKSTLLKILLGLLPATSGNATVLGLDPSRDPLAVRRRVGYMPEVDAYLTGATAVESVALAGVLSGLHRDVAVQRAHLVLQYVGLHEARYRHVEEYSTGMRQRVRLAQAIVHDPDLLFLDEPTNGLDPGGRDEILEIIRDLAGVHGKNVVLCTHLLRDVEATCPRAVLLHRGRVRRTGTLTELRAGARGVLRVGVRGPWDAAEAAFRAAGFAVERGEGALLVTPPEGAGPREVLRAAAACGIDLRSIRPDEVTLEDAFVAAVGEGAAGAR